MKRHYSERNMELLLIDLGVELMTFDYKTTESCGMSSKVSKETLDLLGQRKETFNRHATTKTRDLFKTEGWVYQDYILGLDHAGFYQGNLMGIDLTLNPDALGKKFRTKSDLTDIYKYIGFDKVIVLHWLELDLDEEFDSYLLLSKPRKQRMIKAMKGLLSAALLSDSYIQIHTL